MTPFSRRSSSIPWANPSPSAADFVAKTRKRRSKTTYASLLDEGTAAVESMLVAFRFCKDNKNVFLVSENCHIQTIKLLETRAEPLGIEIKIGNLESLFRENEDNFFGFISQYHDYLGSVRDHDFLISTAKSQNAVSIFINLFK